MASGVIQLALIDPGVGAVCAAAVLSSKGALLGCMPFNFSWQEVQGGVG
jgi:hypothetical protein